VADDEKKWWTGKVHAGYEGGNNKGTCILKCAESLQPSVWNVRDGR
jgi:hypothetical protein